MGLRSITGISIAVLISAVVFGCAIKKVVKPPNKRYIACCDPGLNADDKDMCKWMVEKGTTRLYRYGDLFEGVWDGCEKGKEPWRQWE